MKLPSIMEVRESSKIAAVIAALVSAVGGDDTQTPTNVMPIILMGQSEINALIDPGPFYNMSPVPDVTGTNMVVVSQLGDGVAPTEYEVTNDNISAGLVSESMGALACYLRDTVGTTIKFIIGDCAVPGTTRGSLADDSTDETAGVDGQKRYWSDFTSVVDLIESSYGPIKYVIECWYNADAAAIDQFADNFWPLYFGVDSSGTTHTLGTTHTGPTVSYRVDHCLWDADAADGVKGRGVFTKADTKWYVLTPMPFSNGPESPADEALNFSDGDYRLTEPDRQVIHDLTSYPEAQSVGLIVGPSAHMCNFDGGIHPAENTDPDGKGLFAMAFVPALATTVDSQILEPYIESVEGPETGEYADLVVRLPNGGDLTTLRNLRASKGEYTKEFVQSLRHDKSTRGHRTPTALLKQLGVDTLPTGVTYNSSNNTVTIAEGSSVTELVEWDFSGVQMIWRGHVETVRDCLFTERTSDVTYSIIDGYTTGSIGTLEWCTFIGDGADSVIGAAISGRVTAPTSTFVVGVLRRCAFFNIPEDVIKSGWSGTIVENYFDSPVNLPAKPALWDSGTTYNTDDYVYTEGVNNSIYAFRSKVDGNIGNQPPTTKSDTTEWENFDPHVDQINPFAIIGDGLLVAGNYSNMDADDAEYVTSGYGWGVTNNIRAIRNNGTDVEFVSSAFTNNILVRGVQANGEKANSTPSQLPDIAGDTSSGYTYISEQQTFTDNWIETSFNGDLWYTGDELEHVITGNVEYDGVRTILSPHKQDVIGVELFRPSTAQRRPVFQEVETTYNVAHRGRSVIVDAGSGTPRRGKVRYIPEVGSELEFGTSFSYLRGQATAQLLKPRDVDSRLYLDFLMEHIPSLYVEGDYPYEGVPVRPLQADIQSAVPAPPFVARWSEFDGEVAMYTTSSMAMGSSGTVSFAYRNTDATWSQQKMIFQAGGSGTVRLELATTSSNRLQFRIHDGTTLGAIAFYAAPGNVPFVADQGYQVNISWTAGGNVVIAVDKQVVSTTAIASVWTGTLNQFGVAADRIGRTGPSYVYGAIATLGHLYINLTEHIDFTTQSNLDLFADADSPIDIGANGEDPTGSSPVVYMDGDGAEWNNLGTGGAFTVTGTITAAADTPTYG